MNHDAPFSFFESDDPELFARYVELRRRVFFDQYPGLPGDFGLPDDIDRVSRFAYATRGGVLCGGGRLTISHPDQPRVLPLEEGKGALRADPSLAKLRLAACPYGEISRLAVDRKCANSLDIGFNIGRELCRVAARMGADVIFSICPNGPARLNRMNARRCGLGFEILRELKAFNIAMKLCAYTDIVRTHCS